MDLRFRYFFEAFDSIDDLYHCTIYSLISSTGTAYEGERITYLYIHVSLRMGKDFLIHPCLVTKGKRFSYTPMSRYEGERIPMSHYEWERIFLYTPVSLRRGRIPMSYCEGERIFLYTHVSLEKGRIPMSHCIIYSDKNASWKLKSFNAMHWKILTWHVLFSIGFFLRTSFVPVHRSKKI